MLNCAIFKDIFFYWTAPVAASSLSHTFKVQTLTYAMVVILSLSGIIIDKTIFLYVKLTNSGNHKENFMAPYWHPKRNGKDKDSHSQMLCEIDVRKSIVKFTRKHLYLGLFFIKVADWKLATLLKKRPLYRCFPVNFATFLRTPIF